MNIFVGSSKWPVSLHYNGMINPLSLINSTQMAMFPPFQATTKASYYGKSLCSVSNSEISNRVKCKANLV
jgi:hypothetical protein